MLEKTKVKVKPKKRKTKVIDLNRAKNLQTELQTDKIDHSATLILPDI